MCCNDEVCKKFHHILYLYDKWDDHIVQPNEHDQFKKDIDDICATLDEIWRFKFELLIKFRSEEYREMWHFILLKYHEWVIRQVK